jgi:hypothetical protein
VDLWGSPPQNGGTVNVSVVYDSSVLGIQGNNKVLADTSMGMTKPAHVRLVPQPNEQAAQWQFGNTNSPSNLFKLNIDNNNVANQQFICDIVCDLRITSDARTANNNVTITGPATVGELYYLPLDSNAGANGSVGSTWSPDGASNTGTGLPTIS